MPPAEEVATPPLSGGSAERPARPARTRAPAPGGRGFWLALLALAAGGALSLVWLLRPWYVADDDASMYLLTARSLVAGEGYSFLGIPFVIRPPGFSASIAPVVWLAGTDFAALNLFVSLLGLAAVLLLFALEHRRLGVAAAFAVAVAVWLNPLFRRLSNQAMSDVPGAALLVACLLLERWAAARPGARRELALACAIAAAAYVRSLNVLLVPAIAAARLWAELSAGGRAALRPRALARRLGILVLVPSLLLMPWSIRNTLHHPEPPADQTWLYSYSTGMWNVDKGDPRSPRVPWSEVAARPRERLGQALATLGSRLESEEVTPSRVLSGAALVAASLYLLVRRRRSSELFVLGSLAVTAFYFDYARRLMLPVYLLALPAAVEVARGALARIAGSRAAGAIAAAGVLALAAVDFQPRWRNEDLLLERHGRFERVARAVEERVPPRERLASGVGWHLSVYTGRPVWSLFYAARRGAEAGVEAAIDRYGIERVVLIPAEPSDRSMVRYFERTHGPGEDLGEARLYRVR